MLSFLICGVTLIWFAYVKFMKTRICYPSIVFSIMWGANCLITALIVAGGIDNLYLAKYYNYQYMDSYILYFTASSLLAFSIAHTISKGDKTKLCFDINSLGKLLVKYHWIMWLNFFGGVLRIILMINLIGFDSVMDYRLAANEMMNSGEGAVGFVFRITSYIQMLANFYVAFYGFKMGFETLYLKQIIGLLILYAPTQMATGGRLFILYFILFFFGSFIIGRGISCRLKKQKFIQSAEKKTIFISLVGLLSLVSIIAMARYYDSKGDNESALAKFSYITEGTLESEHYMQFYKRDDIKPDYGEQLLTGGSLAHLRYRNVLNQSRMSSVVISIITPLYSGFGYWGSIVAWFIIALVLEIWAIKCLNRLTIMHFLIFITIVKIVYESVMSNSIANNIPVYELLILFAIFYKLIFGAIKSNVYRRI